ncbi:MAG: FG-GAP repeat protein, partial [Chitinophagales bacterium]|nr:FG-GAP repeat protein [Chitinophagales bacterium]
MKKCFVVFLITYSCYVKAQSPIENYSFESNLSLAEFGNVVKGIGDVNNDGYEDIMVAAWKYANGQTNEGAVYIYHGTAGGMNTTPALIIEGNLGSAYFGYSADRAGDVNNDGYDDIIVGAYKFSNGQTNEGKFFIYHGSASGINPIAATTIESNQSSAYMGNSVAGIGDVNNDGFDDVAVGAYYYENGETDEGRVNIYKGTATGINTTPFAILEANFVSIHFGYAVSAAGDVNNDGYDDFMVCGRDYNGVYVDEGFVYIYHGAASITSPASIIYGDGPFDHIGDVMAAIGDVNNDGYDDIALQHHIVSVNYTVSIHHGSATGINIAPSVVLATDQDLAGFGNGLSGAGDFNNDGYDDLIIGMDSYDFANGNSGRAGIYIGSSTGINSNIYTSFQVGQGSGEFGSSVASVGDINNDGFDDVLVGAPFMDNIENVEGMAFLYFGESCVAQTYFADYDSDGFGNALLYTTGCFDVPFGYNVDNTDCDDDVPEKNPTTIWYYDFDGDGYYAGTGSPINQCDTPATPNYSIGIIAGDCDDLNSLVHPDFIEQPDGIDNNCDGNIDEEIEWIYGGVIQSDQSNSLFGMAVGSGDLNGDGYSDLIAAKKKYSNGETSEGALYVYNGSSSGLIMIPSAILEINQASAELGGAINANGDFNGDGYDDLVASALEGDNGQSNEGLVYIFNGSATGVSLTPSLLLEMNQASSNFGVGISNADINNDGYDDLIVGANEFDDGSTNEGEVFVYLGSASGLNPIASAELECNQATAYFGYAVSGIGDVNADGYDDVAIGAYNYDNGSTNEGRVFIYHGSPVGLNTTAAVTMESNQANSLFGISIAGNGDINNDGFDDIVIGCHSYTNGQLHEGRAFIYYGSPTGLSSTASLTLEGNQQQVFFSASCAFLGDVNGDNFDDVVIAADAYSLNMLDEGAVFIYHGSAAGLIPFPKEIFGGNQTESQYGHAVCGTGDMNGDGFSDLAVGAWDYDFDLIDEGGVFIYYSNPCSAIPETCNAFDDNCNGLIDDEITETINISAGGPIIFCQGGSVLLTATYSGASVQWKKNGANIPGATSSTYSVNKSGNYTAVTTSPCGTATSSTINVTVNKNPNASISAGGATTFCAGGSVTLTEVPVAGCSYQWYKGASSIAGATSTNYIATTAGNYKCRVTKTASGCFKNSNTIIVTVPCKEGEELIKEENNNFTIFPNPNSGTFNLAFTSSTGGTSPLKGGQRGVIEIF